MQNSLQSRFTKLTKSFGKGLVAALKGGGIAGIALGLIDKLLNPLKEVQEAIDRTLHTSDDLATNAKQFNTSTGKLAKLVTLAKATGLDEQSLFTLITKFQTAVAQAKADPKDPNVNSVRNFVDQKDTAEAFFGFITQLQKMDKNQQLLVQTQVFGEKQILKMAEFLQQGAAGFEQVAKLTGIDKVTAASAGAKIDKNAQLSDLSDALKAGREFQDLQNKSAIINESMIRNMDKNERIALERENQRIKSYNDLAALSQTAEKIFALVDQGVALVGSLVTKVLPFIDTATDFIKKFVKSPMMRGVRGLFGGKDD